MTYHFVDITEKAFSSKSSLKVQFWLWVFRKLLGRAPWTSQSSVGNRYAGSGVFGCFEVALVMRDMRQPSGYSREELYAMLRAIRSEEIIQHWKVPEPNTDWTDHELADELVCIYSTEPERVGKTFNETFVTEDEL
jgi:hypothetical protein